MTYTTSTSGRCEGVDAEGRKRQGCHRRVTTGWRWAGTRNDIPEANNLFGNLPYHVKQAVWTAR